MGECDPSNTLSLLHRYNQAKDLDRPSESCMVHVVLEVWKTPYIQSYGQAFEDECESR